MNNNKDNLPEGYAFQVRTGVRARGYRQILQFSTLSYEKEDRKLIIDCLVGDDADALLHEFGVELCRMLLLNKKLPVRILEIRAAGELYFCSFPPELLVYGTSFKPDA
jgi:hypothetical protein